MNFHKIWLLLVLIIPLAAAIGCDTAGGGSNGGTAGGGDPPEALWVNAGDPCFGKIAARITLSGDVRNQDSEVWTQTGGTPVGDPVQEGSDYTFTIAEDTPNFEELTFRLTGIQGETEQSDEITVTAVIYSRLYRLGTFDDNTPPHKTEWKLDWPWGDTDGSDSWDAGYWFTFNDSEPGGNSVISPQPVEEDSLSTEGWKGKGLKMDYQHGSNSYAYPFVGFGIKFADSPDPSAKHPFDISRTTGVIFRMKSQNPRGVKVSLISPEYTSWGMYDTAFTTATDWTFYQFPWSGFIFPPASWTPGTAFPVADILAQTAGIQFQTTSQIKGEIGTLWIDEVYLYEL